MHITEPGAYIVSAQQISLVIVTVVATIEEKSELKSVFTSLRRTAEDKG